MSEIDLYDLRHRGAWRDAYGILLLPVFGIGLLILVYVVFQVYSETHTLTNQRLITRKGILAKNTDETELYRFKDVKVMQSASERVLGYGTVVVYSTDPATPEIRLQNVRNPHELKDLIRSQIKTARRKEGVRAAEIIHSGHSDSPHN